MSSSNDEKSRQLGMPHGTARGKLVKSIMFNLAQKCELDSCYQCGERILDIDNLSIEHKVPWLHSEKPTELFFDLDNIAFSHCSCNYAAKRNMNERHLCPTVTSYKRGCRCDKCVSFMRERWSKERLLKGMKPRNEQLV